MPIVLFALAAILTLLITAAHVFLGGPLVVTPLLADRDLPERVVWLAYFCWHDGTVALIVCAAAYAYAALRPGQAALALFATAIVGGIGALGLGMAVLGNAVLFTTPAPYAFLPIAFVGLLGVLTDRR